MEGVDAMSLAHLFSFEMSYSLSSSCLLLTIFKIPKILFLTLSMRVLMIDPLLLDKWFTGGGVLALSQGSSE